MNSYIAKADEYHSLSPNGFCPCVVHTTSVPPFLIPSISLDLSSSPFLSPLYLSLPQSQSLYLSLFPSPCVSLLSSSCILSLSSILHLSLSLYVLLSLYDSTPLSISVSCGVGQRFWDPRGRSRGVLLWRRWHSHWNTLRTVRRTQDRWRGSPGEWILLGG